MRAVLSPGLGLLLMSGLAGADQEPLTVELSCQPEVGSGRLICRVDYRSTSSARIVWADAIVTSAPSSLRPLRARASASVEADGRNARAAIALAPSAGGGGRVSVRARAVTCEQGASDAGECRPSVHELGAELVVP